MAPEFNLALDNWRQACQVLINQQVSNCLLEQEDGQKFVRIVSVNGGQRSAWAFVAKEDGVNKQLGAWRVGDIFKAASWKVPAKHARGNIFNTAGGATCGITHWTGPNSLR